MHHVHVLVALMIVSLAPEGALAHFRSFEARCQELAGNTIRVHGAETAKIVAATVELDDPQQSDNPVEHCHVIAGTVTVSSDDPSDTSTIRSSIRLPKFWNRALFMGGSGGLGGDLEETETRVVSLRGTMLQQRFATVFHDTGHVGVSRADASWALDVPPSPGIDNQKELNYAAQGNHLSLLTAKAVVRRFYHRPPRYSYFQGCSSGGRQGLMAAALYPGDFDGILAGAPAQPLRAVISRMGLTQQTYLPLFGTLTPEKMDRVTAEVLSKCDGDDGVADGILTDPRRCDFDPHVDLPPCPDEVDGIDCFTPSQREFIAFNYSDLMLDDAGAIAYGFEPSSERGDALSTRFLEGWPSWITGTPVLGGVGLQFILHTSFNQFMVFDDPDYDPIAYLWMTPPAQIQRDALTLKKLELPKADLTQFERHGGKLILYHGWTDPSLAPEQTIEYFEDIAEHTEAPRDTFARLFMIPGMAHCEFGPGAQIFDGIGAIQRWVERGQKPDAMFAVDLAGTLSRPLCKYPTAAVYRDGDPANASSFVCR